MSLGRELDPKSRQLPPRFARSDLADEPSKFLKS